MKRKVTWFLVGFGLLLWISIWVGSYIAMRESNTQAHWSRMSIPGMPPVRCVEIPAWMEPVDFIYRPLIAIDYQITGERVILGNWRVHIGSTANF